MKNSTLVITLGSVAVVAAVAIPLLRQGEGSVPGSASIGGAAVDPVVAQAGPTEAGSAAARRNVTRAPSSIPAAQPLAGEVKPALRRLLLVPPVQREKKDRPADDQVPEFVSKALKSGAARVHSGDDDYVVLPNVEVVEVGTGAEGDAEYEKLEQSGAAILERRGGLVFVRVEEPVEEGRLPQAVYNPRTRRLAVLTGTYKVRTETAGAGKGLLADFGHLALVAEFAAIKLSLLQSREGSRLLADLEALRSRPGVVSAELEILEHEARGI